MSKPMTSKDIHSATSLQELGDGQLLLEKLDGPTTVQSGPDQHPVNPSVLQEKTSDTRTKDTSPQRGSSSLTTDVLQSALENRLQANLAGFGSRIYGLKWKKWDMPRGVPICALRASVPRTTDRVYFGGLPTPSGTRNGGKNHTVGRLDEWGGSSNPFRGLNIGRVRCLPFELWAMGFDITSIFSMVRATRLFRK